jgi:23S rRNA (guanosine2251-2'-O)-methyltransferase
VTNLANTIEKLKKENIWVYGSGADAKLDYRQIDYRGPVALVIGHEGKGISRLVWEKCDEHIRLPLAGQVSSLNASVAAGVLMYEVYRQRAPLD